MTELGEGLMVQTEKVLPVYIVDPKVDNNVKEKFDPDDEYNPQNIKLLRPQTENIPKNFNKSDLETLDENFTYLSMTRGVECNSNRIKIIEEKIKEATEKTGNSAIGNTIRVVILNKGITEEAFATPDRTIFISQHLIHELGSLDAVMGVVFHEVGHVVDGVFDSIGVLGGLDETSRRWFNESSADSHTPEYLDLVGLNSTGLDNAFAVMERLHPKESGRSSVHQEIAQRRVTVMAGHKLRHYKNGTKSFTPLPLELDVQAKPTNLELLKLATETNDIETVSEILPKLCKKDLHTAYFRRSQINPFSQNPVEDRHTVISKQLNTLITNRLLGSGFSQVEINYFLICLQNTDNMPIDHGIIDRPESILEISTKYKEFELQQLRNKASIEIFDRKDHDAMSRFLAILSAEMRDVNDTRFPSGEGIPITKDILLEVLKNISDSTKNNKLSFLEASNKYAMTETLFKYATIWLNTNEESMNSFFERAKSMGISVRADEQWIRGLHVNRFGGHILNMDGRCNEAQKALIDVFVGKKEIVNNDDTSNAEEILINKEHIDLVFNKIISESEITRYRSTLFCQLLNDMREYCDKNALDIQQRVDLLNMVFQQIDALPLDKADFYNKDDEYNRNLPDLLKFGEKFRYSLIEGFKDEDDMELVSILANFNLKFVAALSVFENDGPEFYQIMKNLMDSSKIDIGNMSTGELIRLCRPLFSIDSNNKPNEVEVIGFGAKANDSYTGRIMEIKDLSSLSNLPFVKEVLTRQSEVDVKNVDDVISLVAKMRDEYGDILHHINVDESFYSDKASCVILGEVVRTSLLKLLENGSVNYSELDKLYSLLKDVLPDSNDKDEILKGIRMEFLHSPLPLVEKIEFFKEHNTELGYEGLVILASQIKGEEGKPGSLWSSWKYFKKEMEEIIDGYHKGKNTMNGLAIKDAITSYLSGKHNLVLTSADASLENSKEMSTELADVWIKGTMIYPTFINTKLGEFDFVRDKFKLAEWGRPHFRSFADVVKELNSLGESDRSSIVMKALIGKDGALGTEEGRKQIGEMIIKAMELKDPFMRELVETLCQQAVPGSDTETVFAMLGSSLMGNLLFRGIKVESVDVPKILKDREGLAKRISVDRLKTVLASNTRNISTFGIQYQDQPEALLSKTVQKSDDEYNKTINLLKNMYVHEEPYKTLDETSSVPANMEALFRGIETSILGARSMQTTRQMRRFDGAIDKRMSMSFDSNPGMDPLRFFIALDQYAKLDDSLREYLEKNLIDIEGFLAGGSMASTYIAKVLSTVNPGKIEEVVIRELTPGAELEITKMGETFLKALDAMEKKPKGNGETINSYQKKKQDIRLAQIVVKFTMDWCLADIRDANYETNDDRFREKVVEPFNKSHNNSIQVPQREFTSEGNWVRVETMAKGKTLREYLDDPNVSRKDKSDIVWLVSRFNNYQVGQSMDNDEVALVQSDPSIGNYIVEEKQGGNVLHVLDRGLMIPLNKERMEMVRNLVEGNNGDFLQRLVQEVVNYNIDNNDKYKLLDNRSKEKLERSLKSKIIFNVLSNRIFNKSSNPLDSVTIVNDVFVQESLMLPYEIEVPIKNATGISMLIRDYGNKQ